MTAIPSTPRATSDGSRIGIVEHGARSVISLAAFQKLTGADGWIRLHRSDFEALETWRGRWLHFNLATTSNRVGQRYAIVPIVQAGSRSADGGEVPAYVDLDRRRVGRCIDVRQQVPLASVTAGEFALSLPHIRDAAALLAALSERYASLRSPDAPSITIGATCAITVIDLDSG